MKPPARRPCPICLGSGHHATFPYATQFDDCVFTYLRCGACGATFVDPLPDDATFARMYAKEAYHDAHYADYRNARHAVSARLLCRHARPGARVLDYGCGFGDFMVAARKAGLTPFGVEFDADAARTAAERTGIAVVSVSEFAAGHADADFDVLHFGDVLEHLPDPAATLGSLLPRLKPGGLLFAEGPLEANASPVYFSAALFGRIKRTIRPGHVGRDAPTHLIRVNARQQQMMIARADPALELLEWQVEDSGWPYAGGGGLRGAIGGMAKRLGGVTLAGVTLGNRFRAIYRRA